MRSTFAILSTMLAVTAAAHASPERAADQKAIGKVSADWMAAWNRHDPEGLAAVYSEEGDVINPMGVVARGRSQLVDLWKREHGGPLKDSKMTVTCEPARFLTQEVASMDCDFSLAGMAGATGPMRGHQTHILQRAGQKWEIVETRAMVPREGPPGSVKAAAPTK